MSKIDLASRVPAQYEKQALTEIIRAICNQVNALSEGRLAARYNAQASVPTGTAASYGVGDLVPDSNATVRAGANVAESYVRLGWINVAPGSVGTLKEVRALTADIASTALRSKVITLTRTPATASGDVAYTGVGFQPTSLVAFGAQGASANVGFSAIADSSKTAAALFDGNAPYTFTSSAFITVGIAASNQSAVVKSYDADGFTLTWTKTGAPGGGDYSIAVLCLR